MADVDAILAKWARNTTGATESYKDGVMAVKEAPTAKAAAAAQKYVDNVRRAVDEGRFQEALLAVGLTDWQGACTEKGARRISDGVKQATPLFRQFLDQALPYTAAVKAEVRRMPKTNEAEADARLMHAVNKMRQFRFRRRRG